MHEVMQGAGKSRVGAEFLADADEHQGLDESVPVEAVHVALRDDACTGKPGPADLRLIIAGPEDMLSPRLPAGQAMPS